MIVSSVMCLTIDAEKSVITIIVRLMFAWWIESTADRITVVNAIELNAVDGQSVEALT